MLKEVKEIPAVLDEALGFNLHRAYLLLRLDFTRVLADVDLTVEQWQIMNVLWDSDGTPNQTDIAHLTLKDKQSVSRIVQRLEAKGWVERIPDPHDARAYLIGVTEDGERNRDRVLQHFHSRIDKTWGLTEGERAQFMALLKKIRTHLGDP
jgi:DNA-binding MarR family transcriptional regulator